MRDALTCRHCDASLSVDARLRAEMRAYVGDVAGAARKELEARFNAAFYALNEKASNAIIFGAVGFAIAATAAFMAWILTGAFNVDLALPYFGIVVAAFSLSIAAFAYGWHILYSIPPPEALAAVRVAHCSGCGALQTFEAGQPAARCRSCESSLLVPSELAQSLLAESLDRERGAGEREAEALGRAVKSGDRLIPGALALVFVSVPLGVVVVIIAGNPSGPAVSRGGLLLSLAAVFALGVGFMARSTARGARAKRALDERNAAFARRVGERAGRA